MADRGSRSPSLWTPDRRQFLRAVGVAGMGAALAACTSEPGGGGPGGGQEAAGQAPATTFTEPRSKLSGDLKILLWSHFVPSHDQWFRPFAQDWGKKVGVNVTVDHIDNAQIPARIAAEIQAGQGHDVIQYIAPLAQFEPSVNDLKDITDEATRRWGQQLELCKQSSFNPATGRYYAYSPGWVATTGCRCGRPSACRTGQAPGTSCWRAAPRSRRPRAPSSASACPRRSTPTWPAGP
jgi:ABC-type glycerol-3-phosphate transport system substrate-binding protein